MVFNVKQRPVPRGKKVPLDRFFFRKVFIISLDKRVHSFPVVWVEFR